MPPAGWRNRTGGHQENRRAGHCPDLNLAWTSHEPFEPCIRPSPNGKSIVPYHGFDGNPAGMLPRIRICHPYRRNGPSATLPSIRAAAETRFQLAFAGRPHEAEPFDGTWQPAARWSSASARAGRERRTQFGKSLLQKPRRFAVAGFRIHAVEHYRDDAFAAARGGGGDGETSGRDVARF